MTTQDVLVVALAVGLLASIAANTTLIAHYLGRIARALEKEGWRHG